MVELRTMCLDKESDNNGTMVGGNVRKRSGFIKRAKGAAFSSECATKEERESFIFWIKCKYSVEVILIQVPTLAFCHSSGLPGEQ